MQLTSLLSAMLAMSAVGNALPTEQPNAQLETRQGDACFGGNYGTCVAIQNAACPIGCIAVPGVKKIQCLQECTLRNQNNCRDWCHSG